MKERIFNIEEIKKDYENYIEEHGNEGIVQEPIAA